MIRSCADHAVMIEPQTTICDAQYERCPACGKWWGWNRDIRRRLRDGGPDEQEDALVGQHSPQEDSDG